MAAKIIYRFIEIPNKIPMAFIIEIEKTVPEVIWNYKRLIIPKQSEARGTKWRDSHGGTHL
jgi:hypothetical protein